MFFEKEP